MAIQARSSSTGLNTNICGFLHIREKEKQHFLAITRPPTSHPPALFGAEAIRMGRVFLPPSWITVSTNQSQSKDGVGDTRKVLRRGPTFVSHKKERDVHTNTSTAVLFIRGANL